MLLRAVGGAIRGQAIRVVSPEDFIVLKVLSTRERDLEDASAVLRSLGGRLDMDIIRDELASLEGEIEDHPCSERWARVQSSA